MRSDFIGDCMEYPGPARGDQRRPVPGAAHDARRAADGDHRPGRRRRAAKIAPRLVLRLLNDVGDDHDQLPLLQHALMRTLGALGSARQRRRQPIDLEHYEAIGTMRRRCRGTPRRRTPRPGRRRHSADRREESSRRSPTPSRDRARRAPPDVGRGARRDLRASPKPRSSRIVDVFRRPGRSFLMPPPPRAAHVASRSSTSRTRA